MPATCSSGSTLQIDLAGHSSTVTESRIAGFGGAPNMGSDARGRRHPSEPWLKAGEQADPATPAALRRGRKLVVQIGETFGEKNAPMFVEQLDALRLADRLKLDLAPIMVYGDDVTHVVTEEGIANLLLCRDADEREHAIRGVAGYTEIGRGRDRKLVERLRERGVIRRPEDLGIGSARCRPAPAGGALGEGPGALVGRPVRAALAVSELVSQVRGEGALGCRRREPRGMPRVSAGLRGSAGGRNRMERLNYRHTARQRAAGEAASALVGVVASGNLEVLVERVLGGTDCEVEIQTAAVGFGEVWQAVIADFVERRSPGGLRLSINDGGARPDTVALRLAQAVRAIEGGQR